MSNMERVEVRLAKLTEKRNTLLDKLRLNVPHTIFESNIFFHSFIGESNL